MAFKLSSLLGKDSNYLTEYKWFKKAIERYPNDHGLKAQFIKFCMMNRFTKHEAMKDHIAEALKLFEIMEKADAFDLQCNYMVGKYYQEEKNDREAYRIYLNAIKRFNQSAGKTPDQKSSNEELAYSVALNLITLQSNPVDPELKRCFRIIGKSLPLHLKRIELEKEMGKPEPDRERIKQLTAEVRQLKAGEAKENPVKVEEKNQPLPSVKKKSESPSGSPPHEQKGIFSKLFTDLAPVSIGLAGTAKTDGQNARTTPREAKEMDSLKLSPISDSPAPTSAFMAFHNDQWEGPYTLLQLRSMGFLEPTTWVCRAGSEQVLQAYEMPDLQYFFHK